MKEDAMQKIYDVIEEIEKYVSEAHRIPLLERVAIKDDELFHLMDKLRNEIPKEVSEAIELCSRRDEIIEAAQTEAEQVLSKANTEAEEIMEKAKAYAQKTVDESAMMQQAQEQARAIMEDTESRARELKETTEAQAQQLREQTESYVNQLKGDAEHYADQMFDHVLANMTSAINAINKDVGGVIEVMQQAKEQLHNANEQ